MRTSLTGRRVPPESHWAAEDSQVYVIFAKIVSKVCPRVVKGLRKTE